MPVCKDLHHQRAEDRAIDRADAPRQRGAADHGCGDDVKFVKIAKRVGGRVQAGRGDDPRQPGKPAHQGKDLDRHRTGVDAGQGRSLGVAADGKDIAAKPGARHQDGHGDGNHRKDQHRDRQNRG